MLTDGEYSEEHTKTKTYSVVVMVNYRNEGILLILTNKVERNWNYFVARVITWILMYITIQGVE